MYKVNERLVTKYTRGSADDFNRYAQVTDDEGWSWNRLMPYILKNERFTASADHHNVSGEFDPTVHGFAGETLVSIDGFPLSMNERVINTTAELADEFPFTEDMNAGNQLGLGWVQATIGNGTRSSSSTSYLGEEFINRPNLQVLVNARVTRLAHDDLTFDSVEFTQDGGASFQNVTVSKEIILSAGSIMSPHILMHSGIGDSDALSLLGITPVHHLPSIGANLTEHPLLPSAWETNATDTTDPVARNTTLLNEQLAEWIASKTGPLVNPPLSFLSWMRLPDNASIFQQFEDPAAGPHTAHFELFFINGHIPPLPPTGNFLTLAAAVVSPLSRGTITLNSSDPLDAPVINYNLLESEFDRFVMREAFRSATRFLSSSAWSDVILSAPTNGGQLAAERPEYVLVMDTTMSIMPLNTDRPRTMPLAVLSPSHVTSLPLPATPYQSMRTKACGAVMSSLSTPNVTVLQMNHPTVLSYKIPACEPHIL